MFFIIVIYAQCMKKHEYLPPTKKVQKFQFGASIETYFYMSILNYNPELEKQQKHDDNALIQRRGFHSRANMCSTDFTHICVYLHDLRKWKTPKQPHFSYALQIERSRIKDSLEAVWKGRVCVLPIRAWAGLEYRAQKQLP